MAMGEELSDRVCEGFRNPHAESHEHELQKAVKFSLVDAVVVQLGAGRGVVVQVLQSEDTGSVLEVVGELLGADTELTGVKAGQVDHDRGRDELGDWIHITHDRLVRIKDVVLNRSRHRLLVSDAVRVRALALDVAR